MSANEPAEKTYVGCCHCQRNVFQVTIPEITQAGVCDCSFCAKRGILWGFANKTKLMFTRGGQQDDVSVYTFGTKQYEHKVSGAVCV